MKKFGFPKLLLALLLGTSFAFADTVTLKSGDKVEGRILSETENDVTVQIKISAAVTDERTIAKDDILSIDRQTEDDIAFQEIKNVKPDPESSLNPAVYEQIITKLKSFQDNFPNSPHHADVQTALDAFEAEKKRVDAGEVKFRGQWIGKEEAAKMKSEIEAVQLFTTMKLQGAHGDLSGAMNTFDRIEKEAKGAAVFPDVVDYARQVLATLQAQLAQAYGVIAHNEAEFKKLLELSTDEKKTQLLAIAKREQDQFDAQLAAAQKAGAKWMPYLPRSRKSLDALKQATPAEITRLASVPVQKMREANARVEKAKAAIEAKDFETADKLIKEAQTLWADSDSVKRLGEILSAAKAAPKPAAIAAAKRAEAEAAASAAAEKAKTEEESKKPFFLTIPGAMTIVGVVILVAGAIALMGRGRKPTDEEPK